MKNTTYLIFVLGVILAITIMTSIDQSDASPAPEPKRRKSGGSRKSSSGTSWWGGSNKQKNSGYGNSGYGNSGYGNSGYGNNYKKKSKTKSTLKKAAVIGATAYGAYQLGKLSNRFSGFGGGYGYGSYGGHRYGYREWNNWREIDGFLCRNNNDCNWVDSRLYCQDYELKFTPTAAWFGGDVASIVGECACPHGMNWNDYELECRTNFFSGTSLIIVVVIALLIGLCCCCGCLFMARKMFS